MPSEYLFLTVADTLTVSPPLYEVFSVERESLGSLFVTLAVISASIELYSGFVGVKMTFTVSPFFGIVLGSLKLHSPRIMLSDKLSVTFQPEIAA